MVPGHLLDGVLPLPVRGSREASCDVLISGGGPVGLLLGCHLRELGVDTVVVDPHIGPGTQSKASVTMPRSFEMLDLCCAAEDLQNEGRPLKSLRLGFGGRWVKVAAGIGVLDYPARFLPTTVGQNHVERALDKRYRELGGRVYRAARFDGVKDLEGGGGMEVEVRRSVYCRPPKQAPELPAELTQVASTIFRAKYLVGCDGRQSAVREALGIGYAGREYPQSFFLCDAELEEEEARACGLDGHNFHLIENCGRIMLMVHLQGKVWRIYHAAADLDQATASVELLERVWREMVPEGTKPAVTAWKDPSFFSISCRITESYRKGRCLLAGDAAHCHSPAGGQGMNTGLQDAANLGWKLAAVLAHHSDESVLDTYEPERRPVAEWVLSFSDSIAGNLNYSNFMLSILKSIAIYAILPLIPESLLPPRWFKNRLFGLNISYSEAGTCVASGREPPPGAIGAGDRLPNLTFWLSGGRQVTLLQMLRPLRLALRLLFIGPQAATASDVAAVMQAMGAGLGSWPVEAWVLHPEEEGETASAQDSARGVAVQHLHSGSGHAELLRLLYLTGEERALLVVRPEGYIAVAHRGSTLDGKALAHSVGQCKLLTTEQANEGS